MLVGILEGDSVSLAGGTAVFANPGVGEGITVTVTGLELAGPSAGNYVLSETTASLAADITAKTISVTGITVEDNDRRHFDDAGEGRTREGLGCEAKHRAMLDAIRRGQDEGRPTGAGRDGCEQPRASRERGWGSGPVRSTTLVACRARVYCGQGQGLLILRPSSCSVGVSQGRLICGRSLGEKVTIHPKSFEASRRGPSVGPAGMKAAGGPMRSRFEPDPRPGRPRRY